MDGRGRGSGIVLSRRLRMLESMVTPGNRLVDVGCDHGFLAIDLVSRRICPGAIAMDVRRGPLAGAEAHVKEFGLEEYIEIRLSDGLAACAVGEADTLVCAGMGGRLMERILTEGMEKAKQMRELILQPQSELPRFRAFLRDAGFHVTEEDAVFEEGKYYFAMKAIWRADARPGCENMPESGACAVPKNQELFDLYGRVLLQSSHPVLLQYLRQREKYLRKLEASLEAVDSDRAGRRLREIREEQGQIKSALTYFYIVSVVSAP